MRSLFALGILVPLLVSCGPLAKSDLADRVKQVAGQISGTAPPPPPPSLAPEIANAAPGDVLFVKIIARDAVAPMTKVAQNGGAITWISPGRVTLSFEDGILVATRGLGDDLMGVDPIGVRAALNAGGGVATRRQSFLTSEEQIVTRDLKCEVTRQGPEEIQTIVGERVATKFEEDCRGPALIFKNTYWLSGGEIIRSRQAVSSGVGFIQADQL